MTTKKPSAKQPAAKEQPQINNSSDLMKEVAQLRVTCAQLLIENARLKINVLSYEGRDQERSLAALQLDLSNILKAEAGDQMV